MNLKILIFVFGLFAVCVRAATSVPAGTRITNGGDRGLPDEADRTGDSFVRYYSDTAVALNASMMTVTVATVECAYDASILPSWQEVSLPASQTASVVFSFTNKGNTADSFRVTVSEASNRGSGSFTGAVYSLLQGATLVSGPVPAIDWISPLIASGAVLSLEVQVVVPADCQEGDRNVMRLIVRDGLGTGVNDSWPPASYALDPDSLGARDFQERLVSVQALKPSLVLLKTAEFRYATRGDSVWFTVGYSNASASVISNCRLLDSVPQGSFVISDSSEASNTPHAGVVTVEYWDGSFWRDAAFDLSGNVRNISRIKWSLDVSVGPGEKGRVRYCVKID